VASAALPSVQHDDADVGDGSNSRRSTIVASTSAYLSTKAKKPQPRRLDWLEKWGTQAMLTLTVDEKSTLSPGVPLNTVLPNATTPFRKGL